MTQTNTSTVTGNVPGQAINIPNILRPDSGTGITIASSAGGVLDLPFDPSTATAHRVDNNLVFELDSGGTVTVTDFFVVGDQSLPSLRLPDGTEVASADFFAGSDLDMTTAAGPAAAAPMGGGANYADDSGNLMGGLDRLGSLGTDYWARGTEAPEEAVGVGPAGAGAAPGAPGITEPTGTQVSASQPSAPNDEVPPRIVGASLVFDLDMEANPVLEGSGTFPLRVALNAPPTEPCTVVIEVRDSQGGAPFLFEARFEAGQTEGVFDIPHFNEEDVYIDPSQTIVKIVDVQGGGYDGYTDLTAGGQVVVDILDTIDDTTVFVTSVVSNGDGSVTVYIELDHPVDPNNDIPTTVHVTIGDTTIPVTLHRGEDKAGVTFENALTPSLDEGVTRDLKVTLTVEDKGNFENLVPVDQREDGWTVPVPYIPVTVPTVESDIITVSEAGLPGGTGVGEYGNVAQGALTVTKDERLSLNEVTFKYTDLNDNEYTETVSKAGDSFSIYSSEGVELGTLTITSFDPATGKVEYIFTLTGVLDNPKGDEVITGGAYTVQDALDELGLEVGCSFIYEKSGEPYADDQGNTVFNGGLGVIVYDDAPMLHTTDGIFMNEIGQHFDGLLAEIGADKGGSVTFTIQDGQQTGWEAGGKPVTLHYGENGEQNIIRGMIDVGTPDEKVVFTLTGNADGAYSFVQEAQFDATRTVEGDDIKAQLGGAAGGNPQSFYIIAAGGGVTTQKDGNPSDYSIVMTATKNSGGKLTVNSNNNTFGVSGGGRLDAGTQLKVDFNEKFTNDTLLYSDKVELGVQTQSGGAVSSTLISGWAYCLPVGITEGQGVEYTLVQLLWDSGKGVLHAQAGYGYYIDYVLVDGGGSDHGISSIVMSSLETRTEVLDLAALDVGFTVYDNDGDHVSGTLSIKPLNEGGDILAPPDDHGHVLVGGHGDETIHGGLGDDIIYGGQGNDIMYGGGGSDIFAWKNDHLDGSTDKIMDFKLGEDSLRFDDLFGEVDLGNMETLAGLLRENVLSLDLMENGDLMFGLRYKDGLGNELHQNVQMHVVENTTGVTLTEDTLNDPVDQALLLQQILTNFGG